MLRLYKNRTLIIILNLACTIINQRSLALIQCQQGSPVWGAVKNTTLSSVNSLIVIQRSYESAEEWFNLIMKQHSQAVRQLSGQDPLWLESSALFCPELMSSTLFQQDIFCVSAPAEEMRSSVSGGKGKRTLGTRGDQTFIDRSLPLP